MSETPDKPSTAPATTPSLFAFGSRGVADDVRPQPITLSHRTCLDGGLCLGRTSGADAVRKDAARLNPAYAADSSRFMAQSGATCRNGSHLLGSASFCRGSFQSGAGLPSMLLAAKILDQMVPDADLASADVLG